MEVELLDTTAGVMNKRVAAEMNKRRQR